MSEEVSKALREETTKVYKTVAAGVLAQCMMSDDVLSSADLAEVTALLLC